MLFSRDHIKTSWSESPRWSARQDPKFPAPSTKTLPFGDSEADGILKLRVYVGVKAGFVDRREGRVSRSRRRGKLAKNNLWGIWGNTLMGLARRIAHNF